MNLVNFIQNNYTLTPENPTSNLMVIKDLDRQELYLLFAKLEYIIGCEVGLSQIRRYLAKHH